MNEGEYARSWSGIQAVVVRISSAAGVVSKHGYQLLVLLANGLQPLHALSRFISATEPSTSEPCKPHQADDMGAGGGQRGRGGVELTTLRLCIPGERS